MTVGMELLHSEISFAAAFEAPAGPLAGETLPMHY
jgi:hypothetical protein